MAYSYSPFRRQYDQERASAAWSCPFCSTGIVEHIMTASSGAPVANRHYRWLYNHYPKFEGHTMVVPRKHVVGLDEEGADETYARQHLIAYASRLLQRLYPAAGTEIFLQTGSGSAATVAHLHWHVLPALPDDPFRGFEKMGQFFSDVPETERRLRFPIPIKLAREDLQAALRPLIDEEPYQEP